ncbi:MAG: acyl-CoA dehydrogenase family protein [Pseudomonadaceae bacterium]|nr:acyl-CoA dehydrogenase family protein [Pseudomonadaceae bacterium]
MNDLDTFTEEVRDFLASALTPELQRAGALGAGIYADQPVALAWHKILNDKGWAVPAWPEEYGGTGWSIEQMTIFERELTLAQAPIISPNATRMVGPVIMAFGSSAQIDHYLPRIRSGEDWWAQGYSEPGAGSDLASLSCRAERDGDEYVINGTKIWTTHAQWSNKMFCLVRTDASGKPQRGITFLLFDLDLPGIEIKPLISISGDHELNQVFFDDARVPVDSLLGDENDGWTVAKYLLQHERGGRYTTRLSVKLGLLRAFAGEPGAGGSPALMADPSFAMRINDAQVQLDTLAALEARLFGAIAAGETIGASSSVLKIRGTELRQLVSTLAMEAAGHYGLPYQHEAREFGSNATFVGPEPALTAMPQYLNDRAASIYAGSNEVQHNILAKAVLGL